MKTLKEIQDDYTAEIEKWERFETELQHIRKSFFIAFDKYKAWHHRLKLLKELTKNETMYWEKDLMGNDITKLTYKDINGEWTTIYKYSEPDGDERTQWDKGFMIATHADYILKLKAELRHLPDIHEKYKTAIELLKSIGSPQITQHPDTIREKDTHQKNHSYFLKERLPLLKEVQE